MLSKRTDQPSFGSLYLDNYKTTAVMTGVAAGFIPGVAAGIALPAGFNLLTALHAIEVIPELAMVGFVAGSTSVGAPVGAILGSVLAIPFALSAKFTRKFKSISEIDEAIAFLNQAHSDEFKKIIIDKIKAGYKKLKWGIRSYESLALDYALSNGPQSLNDSWDALSKYMNQHTLKNAYTHNGKKLFNLILSVLNESKSHQNNIFGLVQAKDENSLLRLIQENPSSIYMHITPDKTLLQHIIETNNIYILSNLLANLSLADTNPIITLALNTGSDEQLQLLTEHISGNQELIKSIEPTLTKAISQACQNDDAERVISLLNMFANLGYKKRVNTLNEALLTGKLATFSALNEATAHTITTSIHPMIDYPVHYAVTKRHVNIVNYLTQTGHSIHQKCSDINNAFYNKTPIECADLLKDDAYTERLISAYDITDKINNARVELKLLIGIISNANWISEDNSRFFKSAPTGILQLRNLISNNEYSTNMIDNLSRDGIRAMIFKFEEIARARLETVSAKRTPTTSLLLNLLMKIGENRAEDFSRLDRFMPVENSHLLFVK